MVGAHLDPFQRAVAVWSRGEQLSRLISRLLAAHATGQGIDLFATIKG